MSRRSHNFDYIKTFLDRLYPESAPGSPPREQNYDANKPGSRVILKGVAYDRLGDEEASRSYWLLLDLFSNGSRTLSDAHGLATRFVLLHVNCAGGYKELERIEELGKKDVGAKGVAQMCREVIKYVLDELDTRRYWLGWGYDADVKEKKKAAADRRKAGVLATEEDALRAIQGYYELMLNMEYSQAAAESATSKHFDCSIGKVRKAVYRKADRKAEPKEAC